MFHSLFIRALASYYCFRKRYSKLYSLQRWLNYVSYNYPQDISQRVQKTKFMKHHSGGSRSVLFEIAFKRLHEIFSLCVIHTMMIQNTHGFIFFIKLTINNKNNLCCLVTGLCYYNTQVTYGKLTFHKMSTGYYTI